MVKIDQKGEMKKEYNSNSINFFILDQAVQNALLCLRNEGNLWSLGNTMGAIGWRLRKHYFKVTPKLTSDTKGGGKLLTKSGSQTQSGVGKSLPTHQASFSTSSTGTATVSSASATSTSSNANLLSGAGGGSSSSSCSSSSTSSFAISSTLGGAAPLDFARLQKYELVLEWLEYGPDKYIDDKELTGILRSLTLLQHPFIEPTLYAAHNECGCLTIRK